MAWVRWSGEDGPHPYVSQVYIMDHTDGDLECVGCKRPPADAPVGAPVGTYRCWTREEMAEHVQWHLDSGDAVPDFVIPSLQSRGPRWVDTTVAEMISACESGGGKIATADAEVPIKYRMDMAELIEFIRALGPDANEDDLRMLDNIRGEWDSRGR